MKEHERFPGYKTSEQLASEEQARQRAEGRTRIHYEVNSYYRTLGLLDKALPLLNQHAQRSIAPVEIQKTSFLCKLRPGLVGGWKIGQGMSPSSGSDRSYRPGGPFAIVLTENGYILTADETLRSGVAVFEVKAFWRLNRHLKPVGELYARKDSLAVDWAGSDAYGSELWQALQETEQVNKTISSLLPESIELRE